MQGTESIHLDLLFQPDTRPAAGGGHTSPQRTDNY